MLGGEARMLEWHMKGEGVRCRAGMGAGLRDRHRGAAGM